MEVLYTGHIHGFPKDESLSHTATPSSSSSLTVWDAQSGLVALAVVLTTSISLVGLAFAFLTYSLFSDLRSLAGTALLSFLASLFMGQLFFVIGVGGIEDADLCMSLSMAQLYMKLASLIWLCCCCHHALTVFSGSTNLLPIPETNMGKSLAHYSVLSWGFPALMVVVALAFKYSTIEGYALSRLELVSSASTPATQQHSSQHHQHVPLVSYPAHHCWLMEGSAYLWGFLIPGSVLLLLGLWLALQASAAAKFCASLQVDLRIRNKMLKRRGSQIGLFVKLLLLLGLVQILGAVASLWGISELWAIYSVAQGAQGLLTALLVTCNCRVLKLYTGPKRSKEAHKQKYVMRNGCYKSLRDCEKGQYGVLSITNPNYVESPEVVAVDQLQLPSTEIPAEMKVDVVSTTELVEKSERLGNEFCPEFGSRGGGGGAAADNVLSAENLVSR